MSLGFPGGTVVKNPSASAGDTGDTGAVLDGEDPLKGDMATHSSILDWEIQDKGACQAAVPRVTKSHT